MTVSIRRSMAGFRLSLPMPRRIFLTYLDHCSRRIPGNAPLQPVTLCDQSHLPSFDRWSISKQVPLLGGPGDSIEIVETFYSFW